MAKPVRIGVIGLGGMSRWHMEVASKLEGVTIGALCDVSEKALQEYGDLYNVPAPRRYNDYEALIADPEVDAVISATPNNLHAPIIAACVRHGKAIMSEKPFTRTYDEAQALLPVYEQRPVPCMVGFSYRYIPSFRYAKQLIEEGKLGKIRHIAVQYLQQWGAPLFNVPYTWRFEEAVTGTGTLGDLGAHMIDTARYLIGEFETVAGMMTTFVKERPDAQSGQPREVAVDDFTSFQAALEGGVMGSFVTSRNAMGSGNQLDVSVYGDLGTLHFTCEKGDEIRMMLRDENNKEAPFETVAVPEQFKGKLLLHDYVELVRGGRPANIAQFKDGYINQQIIEKIVESAQTGRLVRL